MTPPAIDVLAHHGRTFHLASYLLPQDRRHDAAVLYAFCRNVDDLADEAPDPTSAHEAIEGVLEELRGQREPRPWVSAFLQVAERRTIDLGPAEDLCTAVLGDLQTVRVQNDTELFRYGYGVAGTVGLLMCGVLGVRDPAALPRAVDLGIGMQITNICRDVKEDAERGRVYLPAQRLRAAGVDPEALVAGHADPKAVAQVVCDLIEVADQFYRSGDQGLRAIPMPARAAILVASRVYRAIGVRLGAHHAYNPLHGRTVVPMGRRLWLALGSVLELFQPRYWAGPVGAHRPLPELSTLRG
ncbi:MAG: phytoene/squalene synthase family protein [Myxococcota bacterium]